MSSDARKVVAVALMAGSAGSLVSLIWSSRFGADEVGLAAVAAVLAVGTVALAVGAWWARLLALAWSGSAAIMTGMALAAGVPSTLPYLVGALLLLGCLGGKAMFERYEGTAPPPIDWARPGMGVVRAAVVANLGSFLGGIALAPMMFTFDHGGCCLQPSSRDPRVLLAIGLSMAAVMLVGVVLLARQRTAGLLLVALAAAGLPLALVSNPGALSGGGALVFAVLFGPGILCGWLALGRYLPRMIRFLRV